jgi:hypothetical protein
VSSTSFTSYFPPSTFEGSRSSPELPLLESASTSSESKRVEALLEKKAKKLKNYSRSSPLPDEMITEILKKVFFQVSCWPEIQNYTLVCRQFKNIILPSSGKSEWLNHFLYQNPPKLLGLNENLAVNLLDRHCRYLSNIRINLLGYPRISTTQLGLLEGCIGRINTLEIGGLEQTEITTERLKALFSRARSLQNLEIARLNINTQFITGIVKHSPALRTISLIDCPLIGYPSLAALGYASLESLELVNLNIKDLGLELFILTSTMNKVNHLITSLTIKNCPDISTYSLASFAKHTPNLQKLNCINVGNINAILLKTLAAHCNELTELSLKDESNSNISLEDSDISGFREQAKKLQIFSINSSSLKRN